MHKPSEKQSIEVLKQRYDDLRDKKIQAARDLEHAERHLEELKDQAREQYGTDDLDELKAKLEEMEAENERKRSEYQQALDKIEQDLDEVEQKYAAVSETAEGSA